MKHDQAFWKHHVEAWKEGNLSQRVYCQRHRLTKGTFGYWASKLKGERTAAAPVIVEVGRTQIPERNTRSPIELVLKGRYLLRLWPGMDADHMRDVLAVLENNA